MLPDKEKTLKELDADVDEYAKYFVQQIKTEKDFQDALRLFLTAGFCCGVREGKKLITTE